MARKRKNLPNFYFNIHYFKLIYLIKHVTLSQSQSIKNQASVIKVLVGSLMHQTKTNILTKFENFGLKIRDNLFCPV